MQEDRRLQPDAFGVVPTGEDLLDASGANLTFESRLQLSSFSNVKFIKLH
jgi:hypothetical protein